MQFFWVNILTISNFNKTTVSYKNAQKIPCLSTEDFL